MPITPINSTSVPISGGFSLCATSLQQYTACNLCVTRFAIQLPNIIAQEKGDVNSFAPKNKTNVCKHGEKSKSSRERGRAIRKRFSGGRPSARLSVCLFQTSFFRPFGLFGGCLTAPRSGALVLVKHPPKCHFEFLPRLDLIYLRFYAIIIL